MSEGDWGIPSPTNDKYHLTLPVRCKDCGDVEPKVKTSIDITKLPKCPNCGSAHFGGGGETQLTREPKEEESPKQLVGDEVEAGEEDNDSNLEKIIRVGLEEDLTASYILSYIATEECGYTVDSWSSAYGVKKSTIEQYLRKVNSCME